MGISEGSYSFFDHAADVGIRVIAPSLEDLFVLAGRALMEWIGPPPAGSPARGEPIQLEGSDREDLLVRWLQELLFLFHQRHAYFTNAVVEIHPTSLRTTPLFLTWDASSEADFQEVKAVTYHKLEVNQVEGAWHATVILDI
jgi:SHS2 domain-containing protein